MTRNLVIRPLIETQNPNTESLGNPKNLPFRTQSLIPTTEFQNEVRTQICQFLSILHSFGKITITFPTDL